MRFGASTFIWASTPFGTDTLDLIEKVKGFGFDLIEICVEKPKSIDPDLIRARLAPGGPESAGLRRLRTRPRHEFDDAGTRETAALYLRKCVDIASEIGSPTVSGSDVRGRRQHRDADAARSAERNGTGRRTRCARSPITRPAAACNWRSNRSTNSRPTSINTVEQGAAVHRGHGPRKRRTPPGHVPHEHRREEYSGREFEARAATFSNSTLAPMTAARPERIICHGATSPPRSRRPIPGAGRDRSFPSEIKEIARAVSLGARWRKARTRWRRNGLAHLRGVFGGASR